MYKRHIFIVLLSVIAISIMYSNSEFRQRIFPTKVQLYKVQGFDIYNSVTSKGIVHSKNDVRLFAEHTSIIREIYHDIGDYIMKDDVILELQVIDELSEANGSIIEIISPMDGIITNISYTDSDKIYKGFPYIKISDINNVDIIAKIPERYINMIEKGDNVSIKTPAFRGVEYSGVVSNIMPFAKQAFNITGKQGAATIDTIISVNNTNLDLKPGYTVDVKIYTERILNSIIIPYGCIVYEGSNEYVYIYENGMAKRIKIETGVELDEGVEIKSGLHYNDILILDPINIEDNSYVSIEGNYYEDK